MSIREKINRIEVLVTKTHTNTENIKVMQYTLHDIKDEIHEINRKLSKLMEVVIGEEEK